jgi:transposase
MTTFMILDSESWMNIRRFRALHEAGATYAEIAEWCGLDWRTVKKYIEQPVGAVPPSAPSRAGSQPRVIEPYVEVIDALLRRNIKIKAATVYERLVAEYGFGHTYQRVKMYVAQARPRIAAALLAERGEVDPAEALRGLHRRFETLAGAQAQVDWGDEGAILAHAGIGKVYSFHMTLSYSRDPFCLYTTAVDLVTFWDAHRRAFAHFGGVPASIVYDRTKTVIKRHVGPGQAVPLHPEAAAFAAHYGFDIDPLAAYRPTGKGKVERQVDICREHVLAGRSFDSLTEMNAAFTAWLAIRRGQVHRTHGEVIAQRAAVDHAALGRLPDLPYLVAEQHLRRVGKDCLVSFEASLYSVPARLVRAGQHVQLQASDQTVTITALGLDGGGVLAVHARARRRGCWVVDPAHWDGLPDGHTRATFVDSPNCPPRRRPGAAPRQQAANPLAALLAAHPAAGTTVARRDLSAYDQAAFLNHWDREANQ